MMTRTCRLCTRPFFARGLCQRHYDYAKKGFAGLTPADLAPLKQITKPIPVPQQEVFCAIAQEFRATREALHYTCHGLSKASGVDTKTIYKLDKNEGSMTLHAFLRTLAVVPFGPALLRKLADRLEELQNAN